MKKLKYLLSAAALLTFASACNHDPDELVLPATGLTIATHSNVIVNDLTVEEDFTLVWSTVRFAGSPEVAYTVEAKAAKAARAADFVTLGTTSDTHFTCKNAELFAQLGIEFTGVYDVDFRITATAATGETKQETATVRFDYTKITYLYILGEYQGWTENGEMSKLLQDSEGIFKGFIQIPDADNKAFKLSSQPNWSGTSYGPGEAAGSLLADTPDNFSAEPGLYYMEADVEKLSYTLVPLTSVSLIGEAVGSWEKDVEMTYDAATRTWIGFAKAVADKKYKVRFNNDWIIKIGGLEYNCSLGTDPEDLQFAGSDLVCGNDGITAFTLSLFDYPYTIKEGAVEENETKLYVASSAFGWNYLSAPLLQAIYDGSAPTGKFWGLLPIPDDATDPQILLARIQSPLGTRFGGSSATLVEYAAGEKAAPITFNPGLSFLHADLNEGAMKLLSLPVNSVSLVGGFNGWTAADGPAFTQVEPGKNDKWTLKHNFPADGEFKIVFNGAFNTMVDGVKLETSLGGSCKDLRVNGGNLIMLSGEHTLELDLASIPMTLAIDGQIADMELSPDYLELTGAFAHYSWNNGDPSPQLEVYHAGKNDEDKNRFVGFIDMYKPAAATGDAAEFKVTYPQWSAWLGGTLRAETNYVYDISAVAGDNMTIPYGVYYWDVKLNDPAQKVGAATVVPITSVGLIGNALPTEWNADVPMTYDPAEHVYKITATLTDGEIKLRFNGSWDYNLGGDMSKLTVGGDNIRVVAGTYEFVLDLTHSPNTMTQTAK